MRFSIGKLMALVAVCGVNFFLLAKVGSDPRAYGVEEYFGELILFGGLPMFDLLAVLAFFRRPRRRDLDDFLLGGMLALALYLLIVSGSSEPIRYQVQGLLNAIAPLGRSSWAPRGLAGLGRAVLINVVPQVVVASFLARSIRSIRGGAVVDPAPGSH